MVRVRSCDPGDPAQSRLIKAVLYSDESESKMPPAGKLPDAAIDALALGQESAPWPAEKARGAKAAAAVKKKHWAFRPVVPRPCPRSKTPLACFAGRPVHPGPAGS